MAPMSDNRCRYSYLPPLVLTHLGVVAHCAVMVLSRERATSLEGRTNLLHPAISLHRPTRAALTGLVALLASACGTGTVTNSPAPPAAQEVAIVVGPESATVGAGQHQQFAAAVTGTANTAVTWAVQEGTPGGVVSAAGDYTAPTAAGTFHVVATSVADPTKSASAAVTVTLTPPVVSVTVSPATATVAAGGQATFTAAVGGATDTRVTWSIDEGATCGAVSATGVYTAPTTAATCHVRATSRADASRSGAATVTVTAPSPISVAISPTTGTAFGCGTLAFAASVTGGTGSRAVTWSVTEAGGGTVAANGTYTAPDAEGTFHVVATSVADPSKSATAVVTVTTKVLSVAVNPATLSVPTGGTAQFSATVTTTCGSVVSLKLVDANGMITSAN